MITVALVDDQPLVRAGFSMLVGSQGDMEVAWQAGDGDEVPGREAADVVLMDIRMPSVGGIEATRALLAEHPDTRVIMLTTFDDQELVLDALDAGASGFLLKDPDPAELLSAIRAVDGGDATVIRNRQGLGEVDPVDDHQAVRRGGMSAIMAS